MSDIGIIGGGSAGIIAAITASKTIENNIFVFEKNQRILKKLLSTGNGRCNLSNTRVSSESYTSDENKAAFIDTVFSAFSSADTLKWFKSLGLFTFADPSGRVYPRSNQAAGVVDILRAALEVSNITVLTEHKVLGVQKTDTGFNVHMDKKDISLDKLIVATGGPASPKLGGSFSGLDILSSMGHSIIPPHPSLVQIKTVSSYPLALKGVKAVARLRIFHKNACLSDLTDEVLFTEYGLSGPAALNSSKGNTFDDRMDCDSFTAELDFAQELTRDELMQYINERHVSLDNILTGLVHKKLGQMLVKYAEIPFGTVSSDLTNQQKQRLVSAVKTFRLKIAGTTGFENAQVSSGGAALCDFFPETLQSRITQGLYAAGEVLDVDGYCGGFNLQWAWSSGLVAGRLGENAQDR